VNHFINAFKLYGVFSGRSSRTEYWMFTLVYILVYTALMLIALLLDNEAFHFVVSILTLGVIVPSLSITARRLHDAGRSGWWQATPFIGYFFAMIGVLQQSQFLMITAAIFALVLTVLLLIFLVQSSQDDNKYGTKPQL